MHYVTNETEAFRNGTYALYFYASWLNFHKKYCIMIDKVEEKYNIHYFAIDTDAFPKIVNMYNVNSIPTVIVIKDNKEIKRIEGMVLTSAFTSAMVDIIDKKDVK